MDPRRLLVEVGGLVRLAGHAGRNRLTRDLVGRWVIHRGGRGLLGSIVRVGRRGSRCLSHRGSAEVVCGGRVLHLADSLVCSVAGGSVGPTVIGRADLALVQSGCGTIPLADVRMVVAVVVRVFLGRLIVATVLSTTLGSYLGLALVLALGRVARLVRIGDANEVQDPLKEGHLLVARHILPPYPLDFRKVVVPCRFMGVGQPPLVSRELLGDLVAPHPSLDGKVSMLLCRLAMHEGCPLVSTGGSLALCLVRRCRCFLRDLTAP